MKIVLRSFRNIAQASNDYRRRLEHHHLQCPKRHQSNLRLLATRFDGLRNVARNHLPHPERYFEKNLFDDLEKRGYDYKNLNEIGVGTLHYDMDNIASNTNLRDWVPAWCFPFIFWAAKQVGGRVSGRLDWFTGKGIEIKGKPHTVGNLKDAEKIPLSDHDAITLDFAPLKR